MSQKVNWEHIRKEVFKKQNQLAIAIIGFVPPILGALEYLLEIENGHTKNWGPYAFLYGWIYSYIVTASLFYGSAFIIQLLNTKLPWKGNTSKRVLVEVLLILGYSTVAQVSLLYLLEGSPLIGIEAPLAFSDYARSVAFSNTITIIVVALIEGIYFFRNWRETLLNSERLQKENAESQLANLRAQLDPHFMFNSLNVLTGLIRQEPKKAESFVEDFARVYRHMLDVNTKMLVPLEEELNFCRQYLRLQKTRFESGIEVEWNLNHLHKGSYLPPLSLQELLSNAIKHNSIDADRPLHIVIRLEKEELMVCNSINLRKGKAHGTGLGLKNIKERYKLLKAPLPNFKIVDEQYIGSLPLLKLEE